LSAPLRRVGPRAAEVPPLEDEEEEDDDEMLLPLLLFVEAA
jgi:hypothetical protein